MGYIDCKKCGCKMSDKSEACPQCGTIVADASVELPSVQIPSIDNGVKPCIECGYPITSNAEVCPECGIHLRVKETDNLIPTSEKKTFWKPIIIVCSILAVVALGTIAFVAIFNNNKIDNQTSVEEVPTTPIPVPRIDNVYTFAERTWLRSTQEGGVEYNKLKLLDYGTPLRMVSKGADWTRVEHKLTGDLGYVSSDFLWEEKDFIQFNSLFSNKQTLESLPESKYRKALLEYVKKQDVIGYNGNRDLLEKYFPNYSGIRVTCGEVQISKFANNNEVVTMHLYSTDTSREWAVLKISFDANNNYSFLSSNELPEDKPSSMSAIDYTQIMYLSDTYEAITDFSEESFSSFLIDGEFAIVGKSDKWGMIDKNKHQIVACEFDDIILFYFMYDIIAGFPVSKNGKWGVIDKNGKYLLPCVHSSIEQVRNHMATI